MPKTLMFDAISDIDETLIDTCLNEDPGKAFSGNKNEERHTGPLWRRIALACAIPAMAALLILILPKILDNTLLGSDYHFGNFSFTGLAAEVPLSDVYVESHADTDNFGEFAQNRADAKYVFDKPSKDDMKYVGLWLDQQSSVAILLNKDGTFVFYTQYSETLLRFAEEGYFCIEDGKIRLFTPANGEYSEFSIAYKRRYLIFTNEYNESIRFDLVNIADYEIKPMEDKTSPDAMDFRNITWRLADEKTHINFWNNEVMSISINVNEGNVPADRIEETFVWDSETNTVRFPDWHEGSTLLLTGKIENDQLILSAGNTSYVLVPYVYDPNIYSQELQLGKPYYCTCGNPKDYRVVIIFEEDGRYVLTAEDTSGNLLTGRYYLEGTYEYSPNEKHSYLSYLGPEVWGVLRVTPPDGELDFMDNTDIHLFFEALSLPWIAENGAAMFINEEGVIIIQYRRVFTDEVIVDDCVKLSPM